jgi:ribonucleoside-triphosphate reductase
MEAFVHNLNTMHSRAGAQIPFSSINYGTDTSPEGRLVIESVLLATEAGLGNGETAIFPIHIFKVKEGISYNPGDPNYDLFQLACRVSAKRLFPNFSFLDAPFNLQYYKPGNHDTEVAYMGCRTRVIGNHYDKTRQTVGGEEPELYLH